MDGYQPGVWSNQFIQDINSIHSVLIKNNLRKRSAKTKKIWEELVRDVLKKRWEGKTISQDVCLKFFPKVVTENLNYSVNIKNLEIRDDQKSRNRDDSTDLILLLDIAAEGYYKQRKGFAKEEQVHETLRKVGMTAKENMTAFYSIIIKCGKERKGKNK
ncbi:hypothetical protein [Halomonas tibetensis]|uniref:Uncharacterized protein n=1 Tax=Halomonas tibetensis TaxID=2259590 RepID=A0ABV7B9N0_9GAMM